MAIESEVEFLARSRRLYEWSRVRKGLQCALWAAPAVALALWGGSPRATLFLAPLILAVCVALVWRGGAAGRAVIPGLVGGVLPIFVRIGIGCCALESAMGHAVFASLMGGIIGGLAVAAFGFWLRKSFSEVLWVGALVGITGSMGCALFGLGELLGLAVGLALGALPIMLLTRRSAS